ncbi:MAG: hypothetical protein JXR78_04770 [Victivallales bacterium]|nr:hypothetical protein [Victivallales bacterium]
MKKPVKLILVLLVSLLAMIIIALGVAFVFIDSIIEKGVTVFGTEMTGTQVGVDSVSLSLFGGNLTVKDFAIANPKEYNSPNAFLLRKLHADVDVGTVFSDKIVVNEIMIDNAVVNYEVKLNGSSNLSDIKKHVDAKTRPADKPKPEPEKKPETAPAPGDKPQKNVVIKLLQIKNCKVIVSSTLLKNGNIELTLPNIELKGLGESKATSAEEVFKEVFDKIMTETVKAVSNNPDASPLKSALDSFKGTSSEIKKATEGVVDSIKKLF